MINAVLGKKSTYRRQETLRASVFLIPAIAVLLLTSVFPLLYSLYLSVFQWNMLMPFAEPRFVGLTNFVNAFRNADFLGSLRLSFTYVFIAVTIEFLLGMGIALLVTARIKGLAVYRVAMLVPLMMTPVVAGVLWRFLLNPRYGVINYFASLLGGSATTTWLATPTLAFASIVMVEVWQQTPVVVFILAAGISSLPQMVFESADIDGASGLQQFRYITLPLLAPVIAVVLLIRVMDCFKLFDVIYTLTYGGPGKSTEVVSLYIYKEGLKYFQIGRATSMSWIFLVIVLFISFFFMRQVWKEQKY